MNKPEVKPDWRIVKVDYTWACDAKWIAEKKVGSCGIFYLYDATLHVHICSLTPSSEIWAMHPYAVPAEGAEWDEEGETATEVEMAMMSDEEPCTYMDPGRLEKLPFKPATKYFTIPEREEDENDSDWRRRVAEEGREHFAGNPVWF